MLNPKDGLEKKVRKVGVGNESITVLVNELLGFPVNGSRLMVLASEVKQVPICLVLEWVTGKKSQDCRLGNKRKGKDRLTHLVLRPVFGKVGRSVSKSALCCISESGYVA